MGVTFIKGGLYLPFLRRETDPKENAILLKENFMNMEIVTNFEVVKVIGEHSQCIC